MHTESELKHLRYAQIEKQADAVGRIIGVRRLKPSEQTKLAGMTAELSGSDLVTRLDGTKVEIPHRAPLALVASVCYIMVEGEEVRVPFPRNRQELDALYDRLDVEGLIAAGAAMEKLQETAPTLEVVKEEAKNS